MQPEAGSSQHDSASPSGQPPANEQQLTLHIYYQNKATDKTVQVKTDDSISYLLQACCRLCGVEDVENHCVRDYYGQSMQYEQLDPSKHVRDYELLSKQDILLAVKETAPSATSSMAIVPVPSAPTVTSSGSLANGFLNSSGSQGPRSAPLLQGDRENVAQMRREKGIPGTAGLSNLGNTCFMNSALQCLAHCVPLIRPFLSGAFADDINPKNLVGSGGALARSFADVIQKLWQADVRTVEPRQLKYVISRKHSDFSGYRQHDSQELLTFLLDELHEDINRAVDKPFREEHPEDLPDAELAQDVWQYHVARNDSIVVDHFHGLQRSELFCPQCHKRSRKMEPFVYLTLPIPGTMTTDLDVTLITLDGSQPPVVHTVQVPKAGRVNSLYRAVAEAAGISADAAESALCLALVRSHSLDSLLLDGSEELPLLGMFGPTVVAYHYPSPLLGPKDGGVQAVFHFKQRVCRHSSLGMGSFSCMPLVFWMPPGCTSEHDLCQLPPPPAAVPSPGPYHCHLALLPSTPLADLLAAALAPARRAPRPSQPAQPQPAAIDGDAGPPVDPLDAPATTSTPPADNQGAAGPSPHRPASQEAGEAGPAADEDTSAGPGSGQAGMAECAVPKPIPFSFDPPMPAAEAASAASNTAESGSAVAARCDDTSQQAYLVKLADAYGTALLLLGGGGGGGHCMDVGRARMEEGEPIHLLVEWAVDQQEYDVSKLARRSPAAGLQHSSARSRASRHHLQDCLKLFLEPEQLTALDAWQCPSCKRQVQARKKLDLWKLPEVLIVHLKRFQYNRHVRDKIDDAVTYPLTDLDLSQLVSGPQEYPPVYELYAVSNHMGSLSSGHYTAYAKVLGAGGWFEFDDSRVTAVDAATVESNGSAYLLFYRRQSNAASDPANLLAEALSSRKAAPPASSNGPTCGPGEPSGSAQELEADAPMPAPVPGWNAPDAEVDSMPWLAALSGAGPEPDAEQNESEMWGLFETHRDAAAVLQPGLQPQPLPEPAGEAAGPGGAAAEGGDGGPPDSQLSPSGSFDSGAEKLGGSCSALWQHLDAITPQEDSLMQVSDDEEGAEAAEQAAERAAGEPPATLRLEGSSAAVAAAATTSWPHR